MASSGKSPVFVGRPPLNEGPCPVCAQSPRPSPRTERVELSLLPGPRRKFLTSSSRTTDCPSCCPHPHPRGEAGSPSNQTVMQWRWARLLAAPVSGRGSLHGTSEQDREEGAAQGEKAEGKQSKYLWGSGSGPSLPGGLSVNPRVPGESSCPSPPVKAETRGCIRSFC